MYISGKNVCYNYLLKNKDIKKAFIWDGFSDQKIKVLLQKQQVEFEKRTKMELDKIAPGNHQGIILEIADFNYDEIDDLLGDDKFLVILDHIEDPHNLGAIIRSCEAFGVDGIIIPKNRSVDVNETVIKTSVGTVFDLPIAQVTNLNRTIKKLKEANFWIVGTDMNGQNFEQVDYQGNIALIIGNEGTGMNRLVKENCDFLVSIPMQGSVNSLNASVAAGIMLFNCQKQRRQ